MTNPHKCDHLHGLFLKSLKNVCSGLDDSSFPGLLDRMYVCLLAGAQPGKLPQDDHQAKIIQSLAKYAKLVSLRRDLEVVGAVREVAMEKEAYDALQQAIFLGRSLVGPFLKGRHTSLSNKLIHDVRNLGFAYLEGIINNCFSNEFLDESTIVDAKRQAVNIAKEADRVGYDYKQPYSADHFEDLEMRLTKLDLLLRNAHPELLRPYETVAVSPKKLSKKEECLATVRRQIMSDAFESGAFAPDVLIPVAQGGNELAIKLSNDFEDKGVAVKTYPVMYSIKTRNQRNPKVENEQDYLANLVSQRRVIVTEDWVTTGNTLRGILAYLEHALPKEIRIATIKRDPVQSRVPLFDRYNFYIGASTEYTGQKNDALPGKPTLQ